MEKTDLRSEHLRLSSILPPDLPPQLSKPEKVSIPERYVELDPEEPPSLEELQARYRKAEKIRNILARSRSALACSTLEVSQTPSQVIAQPWEAQTRLTGRYFARLYFK